MLSVTMLSVGYSGRLYADCHRKHSLNYPSEAGLQQFMEFGGVGVLRNFCVKLESTEKCWDRLLCRACNVLSQCSASQPLPIDQESGPLVLNFFFLRQNNLERFRLSKIIRPWTNLSKQDKTRDLYYKTFYSRNLRIFVISWSVFLWQAFPA